MRLSYQHLLLMTLVLQAANAQTVTNFYPKSGGVGSTVTVVLDNLADMKTAPETPDKLRLFIGGRPLKDSPPVVDLVNYRLIFDLTYTAESAAVWQRVLGFNKSVSLSVGFPEKGPLPVKFLEDKNEAVPHPFQMEVSAFRLAAFVILFAGLLLGFFVLATRSNLLRNAELTGTNPGLKPYAYSLARSQMAWWTFLTMAAALFIWLLTDSLHISKQVLVLMGISFATGLSAVVVDSGKQAGAAEATNKAVTDAAKAGTAATAAAGLVGQAETIDDNDPILPTLKNNAETLKTLAAAETEKASALAVESSPPRTRNSFLRDILSDENGISLHRFQIVAWTLVLGLYFIFEVLSKFAMPEFSEELLVLMGISNSLYIGFKFPERRS